MRRLSAAITAALLSLSGGAAALAQNVSYPSSVSITWNRTGGGGYFSGNVASGRGACVKHRSVAVYRSRPGADPRIGGALSNAGGAWRLAMSGHPTPGYYYARTAAVTHGRAGNRILCKAATSVLTRAS